MKKRGFGWIKMGCGACLWFASASAAVYACSVFVLTDKQQTLFFNNEDSAFTESRIWFIPGGESFYGAVYVGFANGSVQGGMNTRGLALDWVAQFNEDWPQDRPDKALVRGNYGKRLLEQCATVEEAVAFFKKYHHPTFAKTKALIADKTGASVIIGADGSDEFIDLSRSSRGFGENFDVLQKADDFTMLPAPNIHNGFRILEQIQAGGITPTRYSNSFNLVNGEIFIKHSDEAEPVLLNLQKQLALGAHYYVIEELHKLDKPQSRPLEIGMQRFPVDVYPVATSKNPEITQKVTKVIESLQHGTPNAEAFSEKMWAEINSHINAIKQELGPLGRLQSVEQVKMDKGVADGIYMFRLEFKSVLMLMSFTIDSQGKIANLNSLAYEDKGREPSK